MKTIIGYTRDEYNDTLVVTKEKDSNWLSVIHPSKVSRLHSWTNSEIYQDGDMGSSMIHSIIFWGMNEADAKDFARKMYGYEGKIEPRK